MKPNVVVSSDSRGRLRRGPAQIAKLIGAYQRSGLSQVAFCRQRQVPLSSFTPWLRQHRRQTKVKARRPRLAFRPVDLSPLLPLSAWAAGAVRPDGLIVRLSVNAAPHWVSELLRVC